MAGGDLDSTNGDGLLVIRMLAASESAIKGRRIRRKQDELAERGLPHGGYIRPLRLRSRPDDRAVRRGRGHAQAGRPVHRRRERPLLAVWLEDQRIPTSRGGPWRATTVSHLLASPRVAGLRFHRGEVVGKAACKPLISEHDRERILARMQQRAVSRERSPRRYLSTALLRCGRCDGKLFSALRKDRRRYVCLSGPDHRGCGGIMVTAPPLERLIADAVLYRLDTPGLSAALAGRSTADEATVALSEQLSDDRAQLEELAQAYGTKAITYPEWMAARGVVNARVADAERRLARASRSDALIGLVGNGERLKSQWDGLNLDRQHAIVRAVLDHAVILPGTPGVRELDRARVQPVSRL